jgi:hypothetical protein
MSLGSAMLSATCATMAVSPCHYPSGRHRFRAPRAVVSQARRFNCKATFDYRIVEISNDMAAQLT